MISISIAPKTLKCLYSALARRFENGDVLGNPNWFGENVFQVLVIASHKVFFLCLEDDNFSISFWFYRIKSRDFHQF
jgi:hypothetical protein